MLFPGFVPTGKCFSKLEIILLYKTNSFDALIPHQRGLSRLSGFKGGCALKISSREVEYVANLARLEVTKAEKEKFTAQLNDILLYIDKLNELDTKGVEPMSHAISVTNAFREDKILDSIGTENSLANAPDARGEFFRVPKVID
jgi:aspartyl-tRNA(Asn)/glutamyl-tRNA(Gln) amidotransferase subunit C